MVTDKSRKRLPPYISYKTFENFIGRLQQQVPARIDRSYWGETLSGSTGTQLMAALHFLNLVDPNGKPTNELKLLAASKGDDRPAALKEVTFEAYSFVLRSSLDLQNATYSQLEEVFHDNFQLTPDVCRKCIKFFISLALSAGTSLSPFVTKRVRTSRSGTGTSLIKKIPGKVGQKPVRNTSIPFNFDETPSSGTLSPFQSLLLSKFPAFDPSWNDDVKLRWFSAFDELMKRYPGRL
jgi:hypothetical protein